MIEKVVNRANMLKAYHQVVRNKGSLGVDGMGVNGLLQHLKINRDAIVQAVSEGNYLPQSILGVSIPKSNGKNLLRLGIDHDHAYCWSRTRMGGRAVAQSPIMGQTITLVRLRKRGYESMLEHYQKVAPQLNVPLYATPARTVV